MNATVGDDLVELHVFDGPDSKPGPCRNPSLYVNLNNGTTLLAAAIGGM